MIPRLRETSWGGMERGSQNKTMLQTSAAARKIMIPTNKILNEALCMSVLLVMVMASSLIECQVLFGGIRVKDTCHAAIERSIWHSSSPDSRTMTRSLDSQMMAALSMLIGQTSSEKLYLRTPLKRRRQSWIKIKITDFVYGM